MLKVCLDAGHTRGLDTYGDPGAVNGDYWESVAALDITKKLGSLFIKDNQTVVYTRTGGKPGLKLSERCQIANQVGVDCFISMHLNGSEHKNASGTCTLIYGKASPKARELANAVQYELVSLLKFRDRGVIERNDLYVLKHTKMPAILIEPGFITNDSECAVLFDDTCQWKLAEAVYKATLEVFKDKL